MCPLGLCDGSGLLIDFHGGGLQSCACAYGLARQAMPDEVAERLARVVEGEAKARRRAQELLHRHETHWGITPTEGERR